MNNPVLEDALRELDPDKRTEKLGAELMRLTQELEQARAQLVHTSSRLDEKEALINLNPDTGLPIYRVFFQQLEHLVNLNSQGAAIPFAVAQIRLDTAYQRIKNTKDRSKALLFQTTIRIREEIGDTLYQSDRLDEFFLIIRNFSSTQALRNVLMAIAREVAKPHEAVKEHISFGCQIAYAEFPIHGSSSQELLLNAEIALRFGTHRKRHVTGFSKNLGTAFHRIMRMEQDLHLATQAGFEHFHLVFQPFVDGQYAIKGCESLIRWKHPEFGYIPPPHFIPIAERSGDIRLFGRWILYKSCLQLKEWHRLGFPDVFVSVNLSPLQFNQKDLVEQVIDVLASTGIDGNRLKLEITEGAIMSDPEDAILKLNALREKGIRISIDDFGTGYSSLNYLAKLPIDTLKIDKSFVDDVTVNSQNQEIVRAIISMANSLKIETLAEGVETKAQKDLIFAEGCKYIQGYYFSKPVDGDRFASYLLRGGVLPQAEST